MATQRTKTFLHAPHANAELTRFGRPKRESPPFVANLQNYVFFSGEDFYGCDSTSRVPMDVAKAFLNNSEEREFTVSIESAEVFRNFDRNAKTAALLKSFSVFCNSRGQANFVY